MLARFEAERQALALMNHPNIAKVFDAGATDNGRPFFVMELVKGVPLTQFCDKLTVVELFDQAAVQLGLTYFVAGQAAEIGYFGWHGASYVPAMLLVAAGVFMLLFLRDAPEMSAVPAALPHDAAKAAAPPGSPCVTNILLTLSNPEL